MAAMGLAIGIGPGGLASAAIIVGIGEVNASVSTTSGKQGSVASNLDDPSAITGTSGSLAQNAFVVSGPVPPGNQASLPGTLGEASAAASSSIDLSKSSQVPFDLSASLDFLNTDGGITSGNAGSQFELEFSVATDTPYRVVGSFDVDDQDGTWRIQLQGPNGFLINAANAGGLSGDFDESGILSANTTYTLLGNVGVSESAVLDGINFTESSSLSGTLTAVPEPSLAIPIVMVGICGACCRRRRDLNRNHTKDRSRPRKAGIAG
ncbi:MAG: hypothetical protein AAF745_08215 [Planctomycetota bacterium]